MRTNLLLTIGTLALTTVASADLIIHVKAQTSTSTTNGDYEVDYKGQMARIVSQDGTIRLVDFVSGQIAILNVSAKTYSVTSVVSSTLDASAFTIPSEYRQVTTE